MSVLASLLALIWQFHQFHKELCPDLHLLTCVIQALLPDAAKVPLPSTAKIEWEREVKNTDSEEVIERFIKKHEEEPYVTLAQERLKVAKAWTPIKNTIDPRVLFEFLSTYHDPIFEKLAKNSLQRLDDQDWELALKKRTRDAFATYVETRSPFSGRHLQDAQTKLIELENEDATASHGDTPALRTYWDLGEKDPEAKCGDPSTMYSTTEGDIVKFYYEVPSKCLKELPINRDTLKFEGKKKGQSYHGKAYVFTKYCGGKSIGYDVSGNESDDHTLITLRGPAPIINIETCRIHDLTWDSDNSTLKFKVRRTVKIKPTDKTNSIH